jgi:DNA invertase Pin-like site-specific DNA recombinase
LTGENSKGVAIDSYFEFGWETRWTSLGLDVSRLARNNADWHRLLEICALADGLNLDEDGIYDAKNLNSRLLLGPKGAMWEA